MSAKHTKGPWELRFRDGDRHIYSADGNSLMCDMQYYPWCPENDADWSLIAAAPTMYEYIASAASNGCAEASKIMEAINAGR